VGETGDKKKCPTDHPNWKPRGKQKFAYGYADLAELLDLTEGTLKTYASSGVFDPEDIRSVIALYEQRKRRGRLK